MRIRTSYSQSIVAILAISSAWMCLGLLASNVNAQQSRYRFVETKRKTRPAPAKRSHSIVKNLRAQGSESVVEQDRIVHYEKVERPGFEPQAAASLGAYKANGNQTARKPREFGLAYQPKVSNSVRRIGLEQVDPDEYGYAAETETETIQLAARQEQIEPTQSRVEYVDAEPKFEGTRVAQANRLPQGFQSAPQSFRRSEFSGVGRNFIFSDPHPVPFDQFPFRDQYEVFANPRNFNPVNFSFARSTGFPSSDSVFGIHKSQCCDEWEAFCPCKTLDYGCNCGGLKANPGHLGLKWLGSNEPCDRTEPCGSGGRGIGCNSCGIGGCGLKARTRGGSCSSGSCNTISKPTTCGCAACSAGG